MNRTQALTALRLRLGLRSGMLEEELIVELGGAQDRLEHAELLPWFLVSEFSVRLTQSGEERLPVPKDFLREYEYGALWLIQDGTLKETVLKKNDRHNFERRSGQPEYYSLDGKYFRLWPIPDKEYKMQLVYYKRDTNLFENEENDWLKEIPYLLIAEAGIEIAHIRQEETNLAWFLTTRDREVRRMMVFHEARRQANRTYRLGDEDY